MYTHTKKLNGISASTPLTGNLYCPSATETHEVSYILLQLSCWARAFNFLILLLFLT